MRAIAMFLTLAAVLTAGASVQAATCTGLINYIEPRSLYGIQMKGIEKGHTLTITKVDKQNCVLAATTGKGDVILIDANSVSVLIQK